MGEGGARARVPAVSLRSQAQSARGAEAAQPQAARKLAGLLCAHLNRLYARLVRKRLVWRVAGHRDPAPARPDDDGGPGASGGGQQEPPPPATARRPSRRDRRSRGMRGPLAPPGSPLARSRADRFDDLVLDAVERLERRWRQELADVEFATEPVPAWDPDPADAEPTRALEDLSPEAVPLCRLHRGGAGRAARIVLYRRPIEVRAGNRADLAALVHDLVVEQVAELLGMEPEAVDPDYGLD